VASAVIPTRNRKQTLHDTVKTILAQSVPVEVIIIDDGSTDGTSDFLLQAFPPGEHRVRIVRHEVSAGPTVRRNEAAALAQTDFLFTIDDDCLVPSSHTFEQTLALFGSPRVAAVTIPCINVLQDQRVMGRAPDANGCYVGFQFLGGMIAFRRSAYLAIGGYRTFYFMHVEEQDLGIRMLQAGYVMRLGTADPIHHLESPIRNKKKLHVLGPRNSLLYHWYNTPMPALLLRFPRTLIGVLWHTVMLGRPDLGVLGVWRGLAGIVHQRRERKPVNPRIFRLTRKLSAAPMRLEEVEPELARLSPGAPKPDAPSAAHA
jgi:glycosyltransferase involved in cell wall biosynthesis